MWLHIFPTEPCKLRTSKKGMEKKGNKELRNLSCEILKLFYLWQKMMCSSRPLSLSSKKLIEKISFLGPLKGKKPKASVLAAKAFLFWEEPQSAQVHCVAVTSWQIDFWNSLQNVRNQCLCVLYLMDTWMQQDTYTMKRELVSGSAGAHNSILLVIFNTWILRGDT